MEIRNHYDGTMYTSVSFFVYEEQMMQSLVQGCTVAGKTYELVDDKMGGKVKIFGKDVHVMELIVAGVGAIKESENM